MGVKFVENRVRNHGENFVKWVGSLSKSAQQARGPLFPENGLGFCGGLGRTLQTKG